MPLPLTPSPPGERKSIAEMIGEYLREAAVLVGVFSILDKLVQGHEMSSGWVVAAAGTSLCLLAVGIMIEHRRKAG
jgi:hypothetical protein